MDYYEILVDGVLVLTADWTTNLIEFDFSGLQEGEHNVTLRVYDVLGRLTATLFDGTAPIGTHSVQFDASDYPSGVYIYQLETPGFTTSRKMVLLK